MHKNCAGRRDNGSADEFVFFWKQNKNRRKVFVELKIERTAAAAAAGQVESL
jgi:hypothetical protein